MLEPAFLSPSLTTSAAEVPLVSTSSREPASTTNARVLHLINGEHYSGAERVQDLLAARLPELGFDVGFACLKPDCFPKMRVTQTASLYEVPMRSKLDVRAIGKIADIVRHEGYQLLHAHTPRTVLVGNVLGRRMRLPLVYHVHSPTHRDSTHRRRNWINATIERFSLRGASQLITVSNSLAETMRRDGFPAELISVVPNGVPHIPQRRSKSPPAKTWTLGAVALFRPRKGTEVLLDAVAQLRAQDHDVRVLAVGPFETEAYGQSLLDQTRRLGLADHLEWTGFTRDVNAQLQRMDLFVLPSLFGEGLPMVVLEAMAAGVPVVGTQVEGVPEAIRDGIDGVIARPGDPQDLARAIQRVITGSVDWCTLRRNATQRHRERFSDDSMAAGVAAAYRQVLDRIDA